MSSRLEQMNEKELVDFYSRRSWNVNNVVEDDKYYSAELLEDSFIIFYVYTFAYLGLPSPSRTQLEIARFVSGKENSHRLVWAMRRHIQKYDKPNLLRLEIA